MRILLARSRHLLSWSRRYEWDRFDVWALWCLKVEVDRAWLDDKQYNPLNWFRVALWRHRHPVWFRRRVGLRVDRLLIDRKLGVFWLSRTAGERSRCLVAFPAYKRACSYFEEKR
jgi:hypothetical protein